MNFYTEELLRRAANCYLGADQVDDACRCFEQLSDDALAARLHERQGRFLQAAQGYERAGNWTDAARCYQRCELPNEAAACLLRAGDRWQAAWLLADRAGRWQRARLLAQELTPTTRVENLALELLLARCEAAGTQPRTAATRLQRVLQRLSEVPTGAERRQLESWAFAVADCLRRPDLIATLHAAAVVAGMPGASKRWENWALSSLGDTTGIPLASVTTGKPEA
ncbi:MAG: hypothetical protein U1F76_25490 [Candidatus Competibacteraceae bacterium]